MCKVDTTGSTCRFCSAATLHTRVPNKFTLLPYGRFPFLLRACASYARDVAQPKLGKVSNVVKAKLEETLRTAKSALEGDAIAKEMENEKVDVTLPG